MTSSRPRLVVAAAVLDSLATPTTLLCAARSYPAELAGRYELPGGKVEDGESPQEALERELHEEIGVPVTLGAQVRPRDGSPTWPVMHGHRMRVWLAQVADDATPILGAAHQRLDWVPLDQVEDLPWLPADLPVVRAVREAAQALAR